LNKKIVSVILARGGSKGIPQKNIIDVNGQPLISYTIETSINSDVSKTWVSTDDNKIKSISLKYGAKVLDRPLKYATDISKSEDALLHFANNVDFDILVFIQPTSPLLKPKYINEGIKMIDQYDSVFSVYKEHWLPRWSKDIKPVNWDVNNRPRRQDKNEQYVENGAFYITTKKNLIKSNLRYSGNIGIVEMPFEESFQIDSKNDLKLIQNIIK
jgi:CMP-N-acetylneuraminic acid synthetase